MRRFAVLGALAALLAAIPSAYADHSAPAAVTIAGDFQQELGCPGDWQPECDTTGLQAAGNGVWRAAFTVPAGSWQYKAALNRSWAESYAGNHTASGNTTLVLPAEQPVRFYFDAKTHAVMDSAMDRVPVAVGSFQGDLGCPGDWQPDCVRTLMTDADGDGTYTFTASVPAGSYEGKVALNESWAENYGAGGARDGANIPFTVPADGPVTFRFVSATNTITIAVAAGGPQSDDDVEWNGLRHDSRDTLYRTPGGAVPAGTPVLIRLRTLHDDVTRVALRLYDVNAAGQRIVPMERVAADVSCYEESLAADSCDFWQARLANAEPNNYWYRFVVTDGTDTDYYADDTPALDGGLGSATDEVEDRSWALTVYEPGFRVPAWAPEAVVYQIFPDRFRNGNPRNDPKTGDERYDDPVVKLPWGTLPEGYCRNYSDADGTTCPWRFDATPPEWSPEKEGPRGRDYMGGDLRGVTAKLDYLADLGVTTIYFNPIFAAKSNHRYDTANYRQIDPGLGTLKDFTDLVAAAKARGIRVVLDGVFNHMSSDSPFFDRYHHYDDTGACESLASPWRSWFVFRNDNVPCAGADYEGWFGFDSIPVLAKANADVQRFFLSSANGIAAQWLARGAAGWRMDVSGDPSFPEGYWEEFRRVVKAASPDALTISETWGKDTTLLRMLRGDRLDSTMNYRMRDAVLGLLAPQPFDAKGFPDSGRSIPPSAFASRLASVYEDYAPAAASALMNLLDSHDTERLLWTLTPGAETRAAKEHDAAALAEGKQRLRLASLVQFSLPGMPTVYYGDEVGVTGDDDPDDRRTFPWPDTGGTLDEGLLDHYKRLAALRRQVPALVAGDFRVLAADDAAGTAAYGRKTGTQAALVVVNRSASARTVAVPVAGYLPSGTQLSVRFGGSGTATVAGGTVSVDVPALSGIVLATGVTDLRGPPAPAGLAVTGEGDGSLALSWSGSDGATSYNVYVSPVSGGGYLRANGAPVAGTSFTVTGLRNAQEHHVVVRAVDAAGNEGADSNEVVGLPHLRIGWANLQWPPSITHTISAVTPTERVYGQIWIDGATSSPGPTPSLLAEVGWGPDGSNPDGNDAWSWVEAAFNVQAGNNDEFEASLLPDRVGTFDYAYRYSTTGGRDWVYADLDGIGNGYSAANAGHLVVAPSSDTAAPAAPEGLRVASASPAGIELAWNAVADPTLHGYELLRSDTAGGPYRLVASATGTSHTDTDVSEGRTYRYVVRAVDTSFNRSGSSAEVSATAALRTVTVVFDVTVPEPVEDAVGKSVHIAGTLNRLDGGLPEWNPSGVVLTRVDSTRWRLTVTGKESTALEYKYTLGSWDYVEKDAACGEIANRQLTLSYGTTGTQTVADVVPNWRNVAPCGN